MGTIPRWLCQRRSPPCLLHHPAIRYSMREPGRQQVGRPEPHIPEKDVVAVVLLEIGMSRSSTIWR